MKVYVILERIFFEPFQEDIAFRDIKGTREEAEKRYEELCVEAGEKYVLGSQPVIKERGENSRWGTKEEQEEYWRTVGRESFKSSHSIEEKEI